MTFEEAKKSIRWILTVSHPIGSWELENIMDALDITPCDISTCKVAKALWGNKGNIPDIDISRVKNGTPLEAQTTDEVKCDYTTEEIAKAFIEDVEAVKDQLDGQPCEDCISRSELLRHQHIIYDDDEEGYRAVYVKDIKAMPSVTPQRPKGKWIEYEVDVAPHPLHCSLCGFSNHHISNRYMREFRRCPDCGAEMIGGEKE